MRSSPDGQIALEEAKLVANALTRRFGHSDPRNFAKELEQHPELAKQAEQIKTIARMVDRTCFAELTHDPYVETAARPLSGTWTGKIVIILIEDYRYRLIATLN
ncbi:hypothetical protein AGROH133_09976 [Agrobacterium tumefaciens]|nr:hypothetical protein AGROH133_09976 [Agrobacterium tumefaciens]